MISTPIKRLVLLALLLLTIWNASEIHAKSNSDAGKVETNRDWLKIYYQSNGLSRINAHLTTELDSIYYTTDGCNKINVASKDEKLFSLPTDSIQSMVLGSNIPTIYFETNPVVDEVASKEEYLDAVISYEPYGDGTEYFSKEVSIKGRGNSSWTFPKKSYRLKFDKKQEVAGLNKAKSFVLISNYIDNTLMRNAVAYKIAELIGLPYTNRVVPVNVVFNGKPRGSYIMTNKVGINSGSVDIDEKEGILWELDMTYDEEFKFSDNAYGLPSMVSDPDFHEITGDDPEKIEEIWAYWKNDLKDAYSKVKEGKWQEAFDAEQFVKYIFVQNLSQNRELYNVRSVFLYKPDRQSKYMMGPVWDYDFAFGYDVNVKDGDIKPGYAGLPFFQAVYEDEDFKKMYDKELQDFCDKHLAELMDFIDDYAAKIRDSALQDYETWPAEHCMPLFEGDRERNTSRFDENVEWLKSWILNRVEGMKNSDYFLLY